MSKVLLVDTNFSSGPIYGELIDMGHEVHVVGNNPDDYLAKISLHYWNLNYADTGALALLVDENEFDFLVPGCNDRSYTSCVAVSGGRFQGIDKIDACEAIFNKEKFRKLAEELNLPVPRKLAPDQEIMRWPVIVKPVDAFSGRGITVLHEKNAPALKHAVDQARNASPTGQYLIEDFVKGQLHSHTAFLRDGRVVQDFIVREDSTVNPFVVDTSRVLMNAHSKSSEKLRNSVEAMARELTLADGLLHTQFISNAEDLWLIEITRRCPGDLYSQLIELTSGYPYARSYVLPFLGKPVPDLGTALHFEPIMRHTVTVHAEQNLAYLRFKTALQIERWTPLSLAGDQLMPSPYSRIAILFCRAIDQQNLDLLYQKTLQRNLYNVHSR